MIEKFTNKIAKWLYLKNAISYSDIELYSYGIYSLVLTFIPLILACSIGAIMKKPLNGLEIVIVFMVLRKFSGGYHSKSLLVCFLYSSILLFLCIWASISIIFNYKIIIITIFFGIILIIISPMDSVHRRIDKQERIFYKKIVMGCVLLFLIIMFIFYMYKRNNEALNISIGIILTSILLIIGNIDNKIKEKYKR